jgi:hypothetical protein
LLKAPARLRHDARLFVREAHLILGARSALRGLGILAPRLLASIALGLALLHLGRMRLLFTLKAFFGALLYFRLGLLDRFEALLASRNLGRYIHPIGHCRAVRLLAQRQQFLHFLAQLGFDLVGVCPRQGLVFARVGVHLGAVQRDVAQL